MSLVSKVLHNSLHQPLPILLLLTLLFSLLTTTSLASSSHVRDSLKALDPPERSSTGYYKHFSWLARDDSESSEANNHNNNLEHSNHESLSPARGNDTTVPFVPPKYYHVLHAVQALHGAGPLASRDGYFAHAFTTWSLLIWFCYTCSPTGSPRHNEARVAQDSKSDVEVPEPSSLTRHKNQDAVEEYVLVEEPNGAEQSDEVIHLSTAEMSPHSLNVSNSEVCGAGHHERASSVHLQMQAVQLQTMIASHNQLTKMAQNLTETTESVKAATHAATSHAVESRVVAFASSASVTGAVLRASVALASIPLELSWDSAWSLVTISATAVLSKVTGPMGEWMTVGMLVAWISLATLLGRIVGTLLTLVMGPKGGFTLLLLSLTLPFALSYTLLGPYCPLLVNPLVLLYDIIST